MRLRRILLTLALLAGAALLTGARGYAGEKKPAGKGLNVEAELTADDPMDKVQKRSHAKIHQFKMTAGKTYQIDMKSPDQKALDPYLRLEDPTGKQVAFNDDVAPPGDLDAQIIYTAPKSGTYKIIATTFQPNQTGKYTLTVKEAKQSKAEAAYRKLQQQFEEKMQVLQKEFKEAAPEDRENVRAKLPDLLIPHVERLGEFLEKFGDDPVARKAQAEMGQALTFLASTDSPKVGKLLREMLEKLPQKDLKGQVSLAIGNSLRTQSEKAYAKDRKKSARLSKEAEKMLVKAGKDYGMGKAADDALFMLRKLSVGKVAPEIKGEDIDGKEFKLSDYRGKVVVLDFWGNW
jgi:hypothetical protein